MWSGPSSTKDVFPDATIREGVGEMTRRGCEEGTLRSVINAANMVPADGDIACGRRLARSLPSHLQGRRGSGVGELVPQVRRQKNKEVNVRHPSGSSRAKVLGKIRDVKESMRRVSRPNLRDEN